VGSDSSKRPHDPRLLLQVASSPCDKSTSKERDAEISYSPTYVPKSHGEQAKIDSEEG
jgi:hypothetical protein